jgi:Zn-dependent protease with chaperone function
MLDQVVRKLIEFGYERALRQAYLGASVRLGRNQLPDVWTAYQSVLRTLDMPDEYDLYITQFPVANAMAIGSGKPIIVLNSGLVNLSKLDDLRVVLAHECAHILSDHVLYRTALAILLRLTPRVPIVANLPLMAVRLALLEWSRAGELSCDRAAALVVQDPLIVCRTMMRITAGAAADDLDLNAYLAQAAEYTEKGSGVERLTRMWQDLGVTHGLPVKRVHELMLWVRGGDFDRIMGGEYPRRGQHFDVRDEAGEAAAHYRDRFSSAFREAGESLAAASDQVADWLRRPPRDGDG